MTEYSSLFILYYLGIFISSGIYSFVYLNNNKEKFFNKDAFPSFYVTKRSIITNIKLYFFMVIFAYAYGFGLFVTSIPIAVAITDYMDVSNHMIEIYNIIIVFFINLLFIPLLPSMYTLIISLFDNVLVQALQDLIKRKLNIHDKEKENINNENIEVDSANIEEHVDIEQVDNENNKEHTINLIIKVK